MADQSQVPPQIAENNLQPFFVLHKGTSSWTPERKMVGKTRRKIDLSPSPLEKMGKSWPGIPQEYCSDYFDHLRMEARDQVWSKIDSTIKDALRNINLDVFNEIKCWVHESFDAIRSAGMPDVAKATCSYPIVTDAAAKQMHTGMAFTKNMEFVDDLLTFADLAQHLKSHGCHVAKLSSSDISAKNGICGCLSSLLRQFLMVGLDAADMSILASWYGEQKNYEKPVVVIVEDMERCSRSVLSDFILVLSEWVLKIPVILIMGVATTVDAPGDILPSKALPYLYPCKFILGSPAERMDVIIEAVLVKSCSGFGLGHMVATFLRDYFLRQDGTLTSFIRALKISVSQHFSLEPLSFLVERLLSEAGSEGLQNTIQELLPEMMLEQAFDFPSYRRFVEKEKPTERTGEILARCCVEMKKLQKLWASVVMCLYIAGKYHKITLLDLYCEALDPKRYDSSTASHNNKLEKILKMDSGNHCRPGQRSSLFKGGFIGQAISKVRALPPAALYQLLKSWEKLTEGITEIHEKVKELQSQMKLEDIKDLTQELTHISRKHATRNNLNLGNDVKLVNDKAASLINWMVREYLQPVECMPFHEIACFKNVDKLQSALIGDPRRRIQVDLLDSPRFLRCCCCRKSNSICLPSMHDSSIMYSLAQEHGDLINLHDWYQSFKAMILHPNLKVKRRSKHSPSPKKRKCPSEPPNGTEASVQARFCRAIIELQLAGLLRMPSKKRPDYVQRVAFGL